jgi:hypothetical protein
LDPKTLLRRAAANPFPTKADRLAAALRLDGVGTAEVRRKLGLDRLVPSTMPPAWEALS